MRGSIFVVVLSIAMGAGWLAADDTRQTNSKETQAPTADRVGYPADYASKFEVVRSVSRPEKHHIVTVFANKLAASVQEPAKLPYPDGSVFVMETSIEVEGAAGQPLRDDRSHFKRGKVVGLHVMRREKGYGEAYGPKRTGQWEYVEYTADGSYITPPQKSAQCAECHLKAGADRDFVYKARFDDADFEKLAEDMRRRR